MKDCTMASGAPKTVVVLEEVATGQEVFGCRSQISLARPWLSLRTANSWLRPPTPMPPRPLFQGPSTLRLWELATGKQRLAITSARGGYDHDFARMAVAPKEHPPLP
jgi:hypothetical protein